MNDIQKEMQAECWWMIALSAVMSLLSLYFTLSIQSPQMAIVLAILAVTPLVSALHQGTHASDSAKWVAAVMLMLLVAFEVYVWGTDLHLGVR